MENYQKLVERIASSAKIPIEDVQRRVDAKQAKLSGLVSKEGAAQIVAAELGINFEQEKMKLSELVHGMRRVNVVGKIIRVFPIREYDKNGRSGKVCNIVLADESSNTKLVLWDTKHIDLIGNKEIVEGDVISISNGSVREGEIHLSSFGEMKKSNEEIKAVVVERVFSDKPIQGSSAGQKLQTRAFIVQVFEPRYFEVCPECKKKAIDGECGVHGKIKSEKRALLNVVLDDGSETIRAVFFGETIKSLGLTEEEIFSLEHFMTKKDSLLGEEKIFSGAIRANSLYNTSELVVERVGEVNPAELIKTLEA